MSCKCPFALLYMVSQIVTHNHDIKKKLRASQMKKQHGSQLVPASLESPKRKWGGERRNPTAFQNLFQLSFLMEVGKQFLYLHKRKIKWMSSGPHAQSRRLGGALPLPVAGCRPLSCPLQQDEQCCVICYCCLKQNCLDGPPHHHE